MCCVICEMPHTHTHACLHTHITEDMQTRTHAQKGHAHTHTHGHITSCLFPTSPWCSCTHTYQHHKQDWSLGSRRYAEGSECFLSLNAAPPEPPVNHADYFIMNPNLSSRAVSSDRSPGRANALGYFWQQEKPTKHGKLSH